MVSHPRPVAVLFAAFAMFAVTACQNDVDPAAPDAPNGGVGAPGDAPADQPPDQGGDAPADGQGGQSAQPPLPSANDRAALGGMCRHYLRSGALVVEIDWQAGAQLAPAAVDHLVSVLREIVGPVSLAGGNEVAGEAQTWTAESVQAVSAQHRSQFSSPTRSALYVLSVRGSYRDEAVLGVAHRASEMALFPEQMGGLTALLGGRAALERAVLVHEVGHLLCLINIGFTSAFAREDAEHAHHSSDRSSVMHWAIDTSAVGQIFNGAPPARFTAQDLEDLEGLRSGKY